MRQILLFLMLLCGYMLCGAQATSLTVDNQTPGWLSSKINYGDQQTVESLTVTGYLNGTDMSFIASLNKEHNLCKRLDLSKATIVKSNESDKIYSADNTINPRWFWYWKKMSYISFPESLEKFNSDSEELLAAVDTLIFNCPRLSIVHVINDTKFVYLSEGINEISLGRELEYINFPSTLNKLTNSRGAIFGTDQHPYSYDGKNRLIIFSEITNPSQLKGLNAIKNCKILVPIGTKNAYESICDSSVTIVENIYPDGVSYDSAIDWLYVGDKYTLKASVSPAETPYTTLKWKSSNPEIISVNESGEISAQKFGETTISCTTVNNFTAEKVIKSYEHVTGIELPSSIRLSKNEVKPLETRLIPINKTKSVVEYSSSNNEIASVDSYGNIKGISQGVCYITAKAKDGGHTDRCEVTVIQQVESLSISSKKETIKVGETTNLHATILPFNATDKSISWSSSNQSIAIVGVDGTVRGIAPGVAIITAASNSNREISDVCEINVIQPVTGVSLDQSEIELTEDESTKLSASVQPEDASNKKVNWTSSDVSIAMVSPDGTVYAIKPGQATIMATTADGGFVALCKVTVKAKTILIANLGLSANSQTIAVGGSFQLKAIILPENASNKTINWTSTNPEVAQVNTSGLVTANAEGTTQIIATTSDGSNLSAICNVTVEKQIINITQILLTPANSRLAIGRTLSLSVNITPDNASNKTLAWSSTNPAVATISDNGIVTAISEGDAIIIASTQDGSNLSATCQVSVYSETIPVESINLNFSQIQGKVGETYQIEATVLPANASNKAITWASSDERVASVNDGLVKLNALGTSIITAKATDGSNVKSECAVIVSDNGGIDSIISDRNSYVKVYNLSGCLIFEGVYSEVELSPGFYIVVCNGTSIKAKFD